MTGQPRSLHVLLPSDRGQAALAAYPHLRGSVYSFDEPLTADQEQAEVIITGFAGGAVAETLRVIERLPRLELVQTLLAGYDLWEGRLPPGVKLSNCRGAHGRSTAEWAVAALLAQHRHLNGFAATQAEGRWDWHVTGTLDGQRVAILGAGDIGTHLRNMLEPFGVTVTLVGRTSRAGVISLDEFGAVQGAQDAVILAVPVAPETRGLAGKKFLAAMKDGAVLVNAGRGVLVDTDALMAECGSGRITAIVDVTDPEPLPAGHPLWTTPGVTITPHVAGSTDGFQARAWAIAAAQVDQHARGHDPDNLVGSPAEGSTG